MIDWEKRYSTTVDNNSRNFDIGGNNTYGICNIFCNFDITNLDKVDYIKGINATGYDNVLHLDPTVDTEPPQPGLKDLVNTGITKTRNKKVSIQKFYFNDNQTYQLIDIIIRSPSKVVLSGKRYPLESCLIFLSDKSQYLIVCTPMVVSPENTTTDPLQKDLYDMLNTIASNFPTKGKTYSIDNAPNWNPLIFFPVKTGNNASFYVWTDNSAGTITYIQFNNPSGALSVPHNFFTVFANTLVGSTDIANKAITLPADPQNSTFDIYYNQNQAITDITTRYVTLKETIPNLKEMIDYSKEEKEKEPLPISKKGKNFFLGAALLSFILFVVLIIIIYKNTLK